MDRRTRVDREVERAWRAPVPPYVLAVVAIVAAPSLARADDAPAKPTDGAQAGTPPSTSAAPSAGSASPVPFVLLGAGGLALATGVGLSLWANSTANTMHGTFDPTQKASLRDATLSRATAADVTLSAGAVLALAGAVLFFTAPKHSAAPTVGLGFGQVVLQWTRDL
jgi:hypothetical protein